MARRRKRPEKNTASVPAVFPFGENTGPPIYGIPRDGRRLLQLALALGAAVVVLFLIAAIASSVHS